MTESELKSYEVPGFLKVDVAPCGGIGEEGALQYFAVTLRFNNPKRKNVLGTGLTKAL